MLERRTREHIIVRSGVAAGERVVVSPLEAIVDGMRVEIRGESRP